MTAPINVSSLPSDADYLNPDQWVDAETLAKLIGMSLGTLYNRTKDPSLPTRYEFGARTFRYFKPEILVWIKARAVRRGAADQSVSSGVPPTKKPWLQPATP